MSIVTSVDAAAPRELLSSPVETSKVPFATIQQPLLPPSLLPALHDYLHCVPTVYFAEYEAIIQSISGWSEASAPLMTVARRMADTRQRLVAPLPSRHRWAPRWKRGDQARRAADEQKLLADQGAYGAHLVTWLFLLVCRYQYLKLVLRVELECFDIPGMFHYDATNVPGLRNLPSLVLSPEQLSHFSERGIVLDIPPPDTLPVYLPALPASSETCRVLLSVLQYNGYGTVQELIAAAKKRLGPVQGNEAEWKCSTCQGYILSKG